MSRLPTIIFVMALIMSQFMYVAVVDAAEPHHPMHLEVELDHHGAPDNIPGGDNMHSLHDLFHCGGHSSDHDVVGAPQALIDRSFCLPLRGRAIYLSLEEG